MYCGMRHATLGCGFAVVAWMIQVALVATCNVSIVMAGYLGGDVPLRPLNDFGDTASESEKPRDSLVMIVSNGTLFRSAQTETGSASPSTVNIRLFRLFLA